MADMCKEAVSGFRQDSPIFPLPCSLNYIFKVVIFRLPVEFPVLFFVLSAIKIDASPSLLPASSISKSIPVTFLATATTSRTEYPCPYPQLKIPLLPLPKRYSRARTWASAISSTWM